MTEFGRISILSKKLLFILKLLFNCHVFLKTVLCVREGREARRECVRERQRELERLRGEFKI